MCCLLCFSCWLEKLHFISFLGVFFYYINQRTDFCAEMSSLYSSFFFLLRERDKNKALQMSAIHSGVLVFVEEREVSEVFCHWFLCQHPSALTDGFVELVAQRIYIF